VSGQNPDLLDPPLVSKVHYTWKDKDGREHSKQKHLSTGVLIVEPDGRVWITKPTNEYGGYQHTFPKGTVEPGIPLQANAIKEAWEETGLKVKIVGVLGDHERDTSVARLYVAQREGGTPSDMGWESQAIKLAPISTVKGVLLNRTHDKKIADDLHVILKRTGIAKAFIPSSSKGYKLPGTNVNAPSHNKKIDAIRALARQGDWKGILSLPFGTNNYAKKQQVGFANKMLEELGVPYKVTAGQKANSFINLPTGKVPNSVRQGLDALAPPGAEKFADQGDKVSEFQAAAQKDIDALTPKPARAKADAPGGGGGFDESKHPRWPAGTPMGGKFKKKDDLGITEPAVDPKTGKPYWHFLDAYKKAQAGNVAAIIAKDPDYSSPKMQAMWKDYKETLLSDLEDKAKKTGQELGATIDVKPALADSLKGSVTSDAGKAWVNGVEIPHTKHEGASTAIGVMGAAAVKGDKALLNKTIDATEQMMMQASDPESSKAWQQAGSFGNKLLAKMDGDIKTEATATRVGGVQSISEWKKVGNKPGGSNPGAVFEDKHGTKWLVKGNAKQLSGEVDDVTSDNRAKNEVLASKLMQAAGIPAVEMKLVDLNGQFGGQKTGQHGKLGVAVKMVPLNGWTGSGAEKMHTQEQFATHAWLANYDVMGMGNDNMGLNTKTGQMVNIDPGGALLFRAQGLPKKGFGNVVDEWDSMRDASKNQWTAAVFKPMTSDQLIESVNAVKKVSPAMIHDLVNTYGPGDALAKIDLAEKLKARRVDLIAKADKLKNPAGTASAAEKVGAVANAEFEAKHARGADGKFISKPNYEGVTEHQKVDLDGVYAAALAGNLGDLKAYAQHSSPPAKAYAHFLLAEMTPSSAPKSLDLPLASKPTPYADIIHANASLFAKDPTDSEALFQVKDFMSSPNPDTAAYATKLYGMINSPKPPSYSVMPPPLEAEKEHSKIAANLYAKAQAGKWSTGDQLGENAGVVEIMQNMHASGLKSANYTTEMGHTIAYGNNLLAVQDSTEGTNYKSLLYGAKASVLDEPKVARPAGVMKPSGESDSSPSPATPKAIPPGMPDFDSKKLALTNVNAASVNAKIDKIKSFAMSGNEQGLLALGYGTNNYAKWHVKHANEALAALGSKYQVQPGQKPNTHPALGVKDMPAPAPTKVGEKPAPAQHAPSAGTKTLIKVPESVLPTAPDFANWQGQGKGLSSIAEINESNNAAVSYVKQLALNGDLEALKNATFKEFNKDTKAFTGATKSFADHPSKYVQSYWSGTIDAVNDIVNPPKPLVLGSKFSATTLQALAREATPVPLMTKFAKVKDDHKFGFWIALGQSSFAPPAPTATPLSPAEISAGAKAWQSYSSTTKTLTNYVQGSSAIMHSYQNGATEHGGNSLMELSKAAVKDATPLPVGKTLYRWQNMPKGMIEQLKLLQPGAMIQTTSPMPSSHHPTATQGFGTHLFRLHAAKGAAALHSHGSGSHPVEKEVTILPYQRFMLLKKQFTGSKWEVDLLMLPPTKE
jgi:ADP-ribose pyrophosphatase YjhB (NUDIX family)